MPNRDRTGPESKGPMTGRGAGYCGGKSGSGMGYGGRGMGFGGGGRGRGRGGRGRGGNGGFQNRNRNRAAGWACAPFQAAASLYVDPLISKEEQLDALKKQADAMEQNLTDLRNYISDVESSSE